MPGVFRGQFAVNVCAAMDLTRRVLLAGLHLIQVCDKRYRKLFVRCRPKEMG